MSRTKKPLVGVISLVLIVGLFVAGALMIAFGKPVPASSGSESLGVALSSVAEILATLIAAATVSLSSTILAIISFLRHEPKWPGAVALCLSLSCLLALAMAIPKV